MTRTGRSLACVSIALAWASGSHLAASDTDGVLLAIGYGHSAGGVVLDWTGGQPDFSIYRSTNRQLVVDSGNLIGESSVRSWSDLPPPGTLFYYEVTSPCVYQPPEICDGVDNDCNGVIDDPGSAASCVLPHAAPACVNGTCQIASCNAGFLDCDFDPADGCEGTLFCPGGCASANSLWTAPLTSGAASAPAADTAFNPAGESISYISKGSTLRAIYNTSVPGHAMGSLKWSRSFAVFTPTPPVPVPLQSLAQAVFLGGSDGFVRRLDAATGVDAGGFTSFDARRPSCAADQIIATPSVQLRSFSNPAFQGAQSDDLVYVITRYGCADGTTQNRVFALRGGNGTAAWTFDPAASLGLPMNFASEGCQIDYDKNLLYCGTEASAAQHTLWAIDTTNGTRVWSKNAGGIRNRPTLSGGRLYVATYAGTLRALDPADGSEHWSHFVTSTANIVRNPWVVSGGPFDGIILITDTAGFLHAIDDQGTTATELWPATNFGGIVITMPVAAPGLARGWIGLSNGTVVQFLLATGMMEARGTAGTGVVYDPALDTEGLASEINRLTVAAEGPQLRHYCIPWPPGSIGVN